MIFKLNWVFWIVWCSLFTVLSVALLVMYGLWSSYRFDARAPFRSQLRALAPRIANSAVWWYGYTVFAVAGISFLGLASTSDTTNNLVLAAIPALLPAIAVVWIFGLVELLPGSASWYGLVPVLPALVVALVLSPLILVGISFVAWNIRRLGHRQG